MKNLLCAALIVCASLSVEGCGGGSTSAAATPPPPVTVSGVDTPKSIAVVTAN